MDNITDNSTVCSTICSGEHQRNHQKFRVTGLWDGNPPVTGGSPHKGPVIRKCFVMKATLRNMGTKSHAFTTTKTKQTQSQPCLTGYWKFYVASNVRCYIYLNSLWPIVTTYSDKGLGQIGWGNTCSLLTEGTKPLHKPMLTFDKISSVAFTAIAQATILYNDVESNISQITVTSPRDIELIMELCVNLMSLIIS